MANISFLLGLFLDSARSEPPEPPEPPAALIADSVVFWRLRRRCDGVLLSRFVLLGLALRDLASEGDLMLEFRVRLLFIDPQTVNGAMKITKIGDKKIKVLQWLCCEVKSRSCSVRTSSHASAAVRGLRTARAVPSDRTVGRNSSATDLSTGTAQSGAALFPEHA